MRTSRLCRIDYYLGWKGTARENAIHRDLMRRNWTGKSVTSSATRQSENLHYERRLQPYNTLHKMSVPERKGIDYRLAF